MAINFRRWLCSLTKKGAWLYRACDCRRYEPAEPDVPEVVYVSICETSGLRTNPYCPVMSIKPFVKGTEPTETCAVHTEPPPPPVIRDYHLACSCYNLLTARGDVPKFIQTIAANGATACRFFLCETWGESTEAPLQPFKLVGRWTGGYDGADVPIYDLTAWNEEYFNRLIFILNEMKAAKLIPHLVFFDHSSRNVSGPTKFYEPFYSSIQRYPSWKTNPDAEPAIPGGLMGQGMKTYHKRFINRVVKEVETLGIQVDYEIWNEFYGWNEGGEIWPPVDEGVAWFKEMTEYLKSIADPQSRIITSNSFAAEDMAKMSDVFSVHNVGNAAQVKASYPYDAAIEFSGDGYYTGQGNADYKGRRCASAEELVGLAKKMKQLGYDRYEYFDFAIEGTKAKSSETWCGVWANLDLFDPGPLKAMADELAKDS
jgi:hypothetical protein